MKLSKIVVGLLFASVLPAPLCAFGQNNDSPVVWSLKSEATKPLRPADTFTAGLSARIAPGWHLYSLTQPPGGPVATVIKVPAKQPFSLAGEIEARPPLRDIDPNFGIQVEYYRELARFTVPLKVATDAPAGKTDLAMTVRFQTCDAIHCLPPTTITLELSAEIQDGNPRKAN